MGHIQIWHHIFFYQKILKYFNDFQNQNFSVLWLQLTQTMEMKQNQIFFHGTYSNRTWFFTGHEILKYFNDFCNWHLNGIKGDMCKSKRSLLFLTYNVADDLNDFWNLFFDKVYWNSEWWQFPRKISFI